jgi:hypothetical protein
VVISLGAGFRGGLFFASLRRAFRSRAAMRGLATPGATLLRAALRQQDPPRRRVGRTKGGQSRQNGAGEEEQSQEPHRGLVSVQAEPNTDRRDWFPALVLYGVRRWGTAITFGAMIRTAT